MTELMSLLIMMATVGYLMRKLGFVRPELASDLSKVVFYFTLPSLIFVALRKAELDWSLLLMPAVAWSSLLSGIALGLIIAKLIKVPGSKAGALIIVALFGNTTFLGFPIIHGFYGPEGLTLAIFYDLLGAALAGNTITLVIASSLTGTQRTKIKEMLHRVATLPALWALILGLSMRSLPLPATLLVSVESIGSLTTPLILLSIGLSLRFSSWREGLPFVMAASAIKLFLYPMGVYIALSALDFPHHMLQVAVVQAGMPTMFYSLTLALLFGLPKTLVVNTIMVSTIFSFLTLPLWRVFLE